MEFNKENTYHTGTSLCLETVTAYHCKQLTIEIKTYIGTSMLNSNHVYHAPLLSNALLLPAVH